MVDDEEEQARQRARTRRWVDGLAINQHVHTNDLREHRDWLVEECERRGIELVQVRGTDNHVVMRNGLTPAELTRERNRAALVGALYMLDVQLSHVQQQAERLRRDLLQGVNVPIGGVQSIVDMLRAADRFASIAYKAERGDE